MQQRAPDFSGAFFMRCNTLKGCRVLQDSTCKFETEVIV